MKRETIHFIRLCMKITCSHPPLLISIKFVWQSIYKSKRMIDYFVVAFIKLFNTTIQYVQNVYQSFFGFLCWYCNYSVRMCLIDRLKQANDQANKLPSSMPIKKNVIKKKELRLSDLRAQQWSTAIINLYKIVSTWLARRSP